MPGRPLPKVSGFRVYLANRYSKVRGIWVYLTNWYPKVSVPWAVCWGTLCWMTVGCGWDGWVGCWWVSGAWAVFWGLLPRQCSAWWWPCRPSIVSSAESLPMWLGVEGMCRFGVTSISVHDCPPPLGGLV